MLGSFTSTKAAIQSCRHRTLHLAKVRSHSLSMLLIAREDHYKGVIIDPDGLPSDGQFFREALDNSLKVLTCPLTNSPLLNECENMQHFRFTTSNRRLAVKQNFKAIRY